ncbi:MAG: two component transcriptional regulator, LuxR family [Bacteroidetes bacterium]|jgi:DNA-binding NarL/FixJ family response regulator|nr:two component transcriptional regulator, LuxR family [Bacteroidota bacterium]
MIHVAVAEDQLLFRKGIINLVNNFKNIKVVIEATNGNELLEKITTSTVPVHVSLIDINMPVMNGLECMKAVRSIHPSIKNIILTVHEEENFINGFIEAGANAYLLKTAELNEVESAIRNVVKNDFYFNDTTMRAMHNYMHKKSKKQGIVSDKGITPREKEILQLICKELTGPEIAQKLFITESTVNGHRNNLLLKIGCKNTAGLVLFAIKNDIFNLYES